MDCSSIRFCSDKSKVNLFQLRDLYDLTSFWAKNRSIEDLQLAIANSNPVVTVWDNLNLIGSARAISDGVYRATIWDVVIHPDYQGLGLGRKMVETVISHPLLTRVEKIYLMTTHQQKFYERIGFTENKTTTMMLENSYPTSTDIMVEYQIKGKPEEVNTVTV